MSELQQIQVHVTDALRCSHRVHTQHAKLAIGEKASTLSRISEARRCAHVQGNRTRL